MSEIDAILAEIVAEERARWQAEVAALRAEHAAIQAQQQQLHKLCTEITALRQGNGDPARAVARMLRVLPEGERLGVLAGALINGMDDRMEKAYRLIELVVTMGRMLEPAERRLLASRMTAEAEGLGRLLQ
jgi:hypothetical protein